MTINGDGDDNFLDGTSGDDTINGNGGDDVLLGEGGNDTLNGGSGSDYVEGGDGDDTLNGGSSEDIAGYVNATVGVTVDLTVTVAQDTGQGMDTLISIEDLLGSSHDDHLTGDSHNNKFMGGLGDDVIDGGNGSDSAFFYLNPVDFVGFTGNPLTGVSVNLGLTGPQNTGAGLDTLISIENAYGTPFDDVLTGSRTANTLDGGDGDDTLTGGKGNDTLLGGAGRNLLSGGAGNDTLNGNGDTVLNYGEETQQDIFNTASYADAKSAVTVDLSVAGPQNTGGGGTDTLIDIQIAVASKFNDTLSAAGDEGFAGLEGGAGDDTLTGTSGFVGAIYSHAAHGVTVSLAIAGPQDTIGAGIDTLTGIGALVGSKHDDHLTGNDDDNHFVGGPGNDTIDGGGGSDWVHYEVRFGPYFVALDSATGVKVDLSIAGAQNVGGGMGRDTLISIENIEGTDYDDRLTGNGGDNMLEGARGNDVLKGSAGADTLTGDFGNDTLTGGTGGDTFIFTDNDIGSGDQHDHITDLSNTDDTIDLSGIDADSFAPDDQAFTLVSSYDGTAGEAVLTFDAATGKTTLSLWTSPAVDPAHAPPVFTVLLDGNHLGFANFVL